MTRRRRYDPRAAHSFVIDMDSFIQEFGIDTRELRVRECSKYHIQFWRGDRCLLNVWPSQRRFQVAECDGPSEVGTPEEAAVALERAFNRKNQKEPRSIEQEVGEAVGCLGGYLTTYDVQALYDAKKIIESLVHQLRHTNRQRDSDDREDRVTQIFNDQ